jgi:hypothetical protein
MYRKLVHAVATIMLTFDVSADSPVCIYEHCNHARMCDIIVFRGAEVMISDFFSIETQRFNEGSLIDHSLPFCA